MSITASAITPDKSLEEFRVEFNKLIQDFEGVASGNTFTQTIVFEGVTADAFELLKVLLMGHGVLAARFIQNNYAAFVCHFNLLLQSNNYVTCRESIRLLGELLLLRENFSIMMSYISDRENLKILMNLLRCKRKRIQIEAFHLFKVVLQIQLMSHHGG